MKPLTTLIFCWMTAALLVTSTTSAKPPETEPRYETTPDLTNREAFLEDERSDSIDPTDVAPDGPPTWNVMLPVEVSAVHVSGNAVKIVDDCEVDLVSITVDDVTTLYDSSLLKTISVELNQHNNSCQYFVGGNTNRLIHSRGVVIESGQVADLIQIYLDFSLQGDVSVETYLSFDVAGGVGQNNVEFTVGDITKEGWVLLNADLGASRDTLHVRTDGIIEGSFTVTADLGDNFDLADGLFATPDKLNIDLDADILPSGIVNVWAEGGHDYDTMECYYRGVLEGTLHLSLYGNDFSDAPLIPFFDDDGNLLDLSALEPDDLIMDIRPMAGSTGHLIAHVFDGLGDDLLVLQVINDSGATPNVRAEMDGGYGRDAGYATGYDDLPGEFVSVKNVELIVPELRID